MYPPKLVLLTGILVAAVGLSNAAEVKDPYDISRPDEITHPVHIKHPHIFLIGDSTMYDRPLDKPTPGRGWGQMFKELVRDPAQITNLARSGRSTKSYIDEGFWADAMARFEPGDFVIIQFGGNDQKKQDPKRYTAPREGYLTNMTRFVRDVRSKGANPILATTVVRRRFDAKGQLIDTYVGYTDAVRQVAHDEHVPLLDMNTDTAALVQKFGVEGSKRLFMWVAGGEYPQYPKGVQDNSHTSKFGAEQFAAIAAREIRQQHLRVADLLK